MTNASDKDGNILEVNASLIRGWNFDTFEKFVNQRFTDLSVQLRERYEAQQAGVTASFAAAEKAVNAALIAAEKAVDKAESAQQLRNAAQNEFRKALSDLSGLMWTTKEGTAAVESLRKELVSSLESLRRESNATHKALENRIIPLEAGHANIQGRIWGVSALFTIIALVINVTFRYVMLH